MSENNQNNFTKADLAEFTEDVLLPAVENIVDDKVKREIGAFRTEIKDYIDVKLADTKGEIIAAIRGEKEQDKGFKSKLVDMMRYNKINDQAEISALEVLI